MLRRLYLVRHGEVDNPDHVVYADLPGFSLSPRGRLEAAAAAAHLSGSRVAVVASSPLDRATETAKVIGAVLGLEPQTDLRLEEWHLGRRWSGVAWHDLPSRFPGELEAYLSDPTHLPFAPESIAAVAQRMAAAVEDLGRDHPGGVAVMVSHQDPIQALRLDLLGRPLSGLRHDPPGHAAIITLDREDAAWSESSLWSPARLADES
jgi:broad specificity phosphatase PhoE